MTGAVFAHLMPAVADSDLANHKYFNLLKAMRARREGILTVDAQPFDVTINVSVNASPSHPHSAANKGEPSRPAGVLHLKQHDNIMAPLLNLLFIARYSSTGESLLNPQLPEMVGLLRDSGVYSVVSTNLGLELDDAGIDRLLDSGLTMLSIACDGASHETYKKYRTEDDFDLVLNNMKRLIARKKQRDLTYPLIEWHFQVFSHNEHEVECAKKIAYDIGVDIIDFNFGAAPVAAEAQGNGIGKTASRPTGPATSGPAIDDALRRKDTPFRNLPQSPKTTGSAALPHQSGDKCDWLYFAAYLYPEGEVAPCCHPGGRQRDMGMTQHGLRDVWNNDNYQNARAYMKDSTLDCKALCAACPMPKSKDRQFNHILSALIRNAPTWFLKMLAVDGDYWLHPLDRIYLAQELGRIDANRDFLVKTDCEADVEWLQENKPDDRAAKRLMLKLIMAR